jgi:hypothetical protein
MPSTPRDDGLSPAQIGRVISDWLGVEGGYLADFTYASHDRFWFEVCARTVDTRGFEGTTRECFRSNMLDATPSEQALVLRALIDRYPISEPPLPERPQLRTAEFKRIIESWIGRLESEQVAIPMSVASPSDIVRRALEDADALITASGPQSAVDRVHTALHGYLLTLCRQAAIDIPGERPSIAQLVKALRLRHPALAELGPQRREVERLLSGISTILDALNPIRNLASVAHPTDELVGEAEAMLAINAARSILAYLELKVRQAPPGG